MRHAITLPCTWLLLSIATLVGCSDPSSGMPRQVRLPDDEDEVVVDAPAAQPAPSQPPVIAQPAPVCYICTNGDRSQQFVGQLGGAWGQHLRHRASQVTSIRGTTRRNWSGATRIDTSRQPTDDRRAPAAFHILSADDCSSIGKMSSHEKAVPPPLLPC